jgi:pimeloyl-ACP methyl ester carboxylesterase
MIAISCNNDTLSRCPLPVLTLSLTEALARFHREARRGCCDTGRYRCPYFVWGQGPTLVCVPGMIDDGLSFVRPLALLSRHFRCIAYDWPNGGGDGAHWPTYRHRDLVADLFALLDHLDVGEAIVAGYSFGSTVALAALHAQPRRLPCGVLLSGFARRPLAPAEALLAAVGRYLPGVMRQLPLRNRLLGVSQAWAFAGCEPEVWQYYVEHTGKLAMPAVAYRARILDQLDLRPLLPSIRQPILLVCGDADPLVNQRCEMELLMGLRHVARMEIPQCGHQALYTHPELLAETILEFCECRTGFLSSLPERVADQAGLQQFLGPAS